MVVSTQQGQVAEFGVATGLERFDVVDLQAVGDVTSRDHTAPVPQHQGGAQVGVDGPAPVDDRADVAGLGEHQGQKGVVEEALGHLGRDRSLAVQLTQLPGQGPAPAQGGKVDPDDDGGRGSSGDQVGGTAEIEIVELVRVGGVGEVDQARGDTGDGAIGGRPVPLATMASISCPP